MLRNAYVTVPAPPGLGQGAHSVWRTRKQRHQAATALLWPQLRRCRCITLVLHLPRQVPFSGATAPLSHAQQEEQLFCRHSSVLCSANKAGLVYSDLPS